MIVDKSEAALAKIRMMRAKGDKRENILIFKENIDATPILPDGETAPDAPLAVNSKAPLLFELEHPEIAKHADSKTSMEVLAQSEIDAAAQEQREPVPLVVEMKLQPLATLARAKVSCELVMENAVHCRYRHIPRARRFHLAHPETR